MTSREIRKAFLDFFQNRGHLIVPSAPLVLKNDPTLMFINSGMAQFKDFFLGNGVPPAKRIADTQKCLRVSGKHNDLEDVGLDTYHHTMFEMLGNWSFGDYFKRDALKWAWELLTEVYKLPKDRLYVSVFGGDKGDNLPADDEAFAIWTEILGGSDRIIYGSKKDNFWEMGDTGPCGPCSEIHIDLRTDEEVRKVGGKERVNNDDPQVIEIWNNVFMEFNRLANGSLEKLPDRHVDTGMGFERLVRAIQWKSSNYDTDIFQPMINFLESASGIAYGTNKQTDIAMRVISDHIRAISFTIADGQLPSNNKAGYVIRRILRRAVRYGYTYLNFKEPFMCRLVPLLAGQFDDVFPELKAQQDFVARVIQEEETSFLRTLENGLRVFEQVKGNAQNGVIDGRTVFELYDTFGFPVDLTALIARENGLSIDTAGFEVAMQEQKDRARNAAKVEKGDWVSVFEGDEVEFVGYDHLESLSKILKYRQISDKKGTLYQVVLDRTPFYAESGGQVGDKGYLEANGEKIRVVDTKKENDLIIHFTEKLPSDIDADFKAVVDAQRRSLTENNHSATHLLHAALKQVLGTHVNQKGSLVNEEVLRFDFSHFAKMTDEEVAKVEQIVNEKIRENIRLEERRNVPISDAKAMGAMALFGEKYGDFVRVITFDKNFSVELCGGTHVPATGKIGLMKITAESSVAAGVRRIEAVTADKAEAIISEQLAVINELKDLLKNPKDLVKAVQSLIEEKNKLAKDLEKLQLKEAQNIKNELLNEIETIDGMSLIAKRIEAPSADAMKQIAFDLKAKVDNLFLVLAANVNDKPQIAVMISDELVKSKGYDAGKIVRELAKEIKGGGGGQPFFATAGGSDASGLDRVISKAKQQLTVIS